MRHVSVTYWNESELQEFGITEFPDKKRPCLYVRVGDELIVLASFTSERHAEVFVTVLKHCFRGPVLQLGDKRKDGE